MTRLLALEEDELLRNIVGSVWSRCEAGLVSRRLRGVYVGRPMCGVVGCIYVLVVCVYLLLSFSRCLHHVVKNRCRPMMCCCCWCCCNSSCVDPRYVCFTLLGVASAQARMLSCCKCLYIELCPKVCSECCVYMYRRRS